MPLSAAEYRCLDSFSVLYSGGLDSAAVALLCGGMVRGGIHLLTFKHPYGAMFNEWSRRHNADLVRVLGERVYHHLIDLSDVWNEMGAPRWDRDMRKYRGHWVVCLGCQQSMAAHAILYNLRHNVTNTFICSSVGGEYAAMSMPVTRELNIGFYARYGVRYNAPLLDMGINKNEERHILAEHAIAPGWGKRRSHQGYQPICAIGFQHALDILFDWHTTYPPDRMAEFIEEKFLVMDRFIRNALEASGHDPDELIERNLASYQAEQARIDTMRAAGTTSIAS